MPKIILRSIWITGAVLTIGGIIFAAVMARGEERSLLHLLPAFAGAMLLMCMVFVGLIQDLVSDLIGQLRQLDTDKTKQNTSDAAENASAQPETKSDG
ncbi:MAG: hypothetical protein KI792_05785 [Alphaproteobacteria bacterium]|nr:hypothetical protein [Alphaproteobacteria bacterium SS10]